MTARTSFFPGAANESLIPCEHAEPGVARGGPAAEASPQQRREQGLDEPGHGDNRKRGCGERGGRKRGRGETPDGGGRNGEPRPAPHDRPADRQEGDDGDGADGSSEDDDCERTSGGASCKPDEGNAGRDAEPGRDAQEIPVEYPVHSASLETTILGPAVDLGNIFAILFFAFLLVPPLQRRLLAMQRARGLHAIERVRGTRVIALVHRQETIGFLGVPLYRFIDINDSEEVLRAIRTTPDDRPIDLLLHTPGGLVLASEQIAYALRDHPAKVTVIVPHYAMSGGTLLALAADEILMDPAAVLGPVDPQLGDLPAASLLRVVEKKPVDRIDDRTLVMADVAEKAVRHMKEVVRHLLIRRLEVERADSLAEQLAGGHYTHDDPITFTEAQALDLPVTTGVPQEAYDYMSLFPQAGGRRPSVQYLPLPAPIERSPRRNERA
jgi:ClpP class serine protease